jgi:hypothetical protein
MPAALLTRAWISALGRPLDLQPVGHVLVHAHVRIERVVLEHHRDVALGGLELVDHARPDLDLPAGHFLQPGHHAQQRGLAAARGPDDHDEFAVGDLDITPWITWLALEPWP